MSKRNNYSDSELLKLLTLKGEEGMDAIFRQYYAYLCKVVVRILTQEQIAEDIVQDVFYDLWKKREVLHVSISLKAYLRRAAVNKSLNYIRDRKVKWDDEEHLVLQKSLETDANDKIEGQELQALVDQTIDGLPERCRLVFSLSRFEEMSYQEIADHLGISIKTVENQMTKALKILKEQLGRVIKI